MRHVPFALLAPFGDGVDVERDVARHHLGDMPLFGPPVGTVEHGAVADGEDVVALGGLVVVVHHLAVVVDLDEPRLVEGKVGVSEDRMAVAGGNEHREIALDLAVVFEHDAVGLEPFDLLPGLAADIEALEEHIHHLQRLLAQPRARLFHRGEEGELELVTYPLFLQHVVDVEEHLESRAAPHVAGVFRVAAESHGDLAAPLLDQCVDALLDLQRLVRLAADGEVVFAPFVLHFAAAHGDDQVFTRILAVGADDAALFGVDLPDLVDDQLETVGLGKIFQGNGDVVERRLARRNPDRRGIDPEVVPIGNQRNREPLFAKEDRRLHPGEPAAEYQYLFLLHLASSFSDV